MLTMTASNPVAARKVHNGVPNGTNGNATNGVSNGANGVHASNGEGAMPPKRQKVLPGTCTHVIVNGCPESLSSSWGKL